MSKRILVLCQRKVSEVPEDVKEVTDVVSELENYIKTLFGSDVTIEYLTYHTAETHKAYADYMFPLSRVNMFETPEMYKLNNENLDKFLEKNNKYDVIILNTCPLRWLDFNIIHELLKPSGIIVIKLFGKYNNKGSPKRDDPMIYRVITRDVPNALFEKQEESLYGRYTYVKRETLEEMKTLGEGKKVKKIYTRVKGRRLKRRRTVKRRRQKKKKNNLNSY